MTTLDAAYFDQWYADIDRSPLRRQIFADVLGLPPEVEPSNLVPIGGLEELLPALALPADGLLADLACGRGGPGMWVARAAGARVVGVDFAPVAVGQASARRSAFGLEQRARFVVGDLAATGLDDATADAVLCVDAFHFAADPADAAREVCRIAKPGARLALTGWDPLERGDPEVPERLRRMDLAGALDGAGCVDVQVVDKPEWRAAERRLWDRALATPVDGDPAIQSLHDEAARTLSTFDRFRRILVTARTPG